MTAIEEAAETHAMGGVAEHNARWTARYAADYSTEAARDAAYREHQEMLATMQRVFSWSVAHWDAISIEAFVLIDKRIDTREEDAVNSLRESIRNRWEFGKLMLAERKEAAAQGNAGRTGRGYRQEPIGLKYRATFAERYPTEDEMATALATLTSWTQVKRKLPKPPPPLRKKPNTPSVPTPNKRNETVESKADAPVDVPVVIDWDSLPPKVKDREGRDAEGDPQEQEKEFRTRLLAEVDQHRAKLDADWVAYKVVLWTRRTRSSTRCGTRSVSVIRKGSRSSTPRV